MVFMLSMPEAFYSPCRVQNLELFNAIFNTSSNTEVKKLDYFPFMVLSTTNDYLCN